LAGETAGCPIGERRAGRQGVLDPFEGGTNLVAKLLEPGARLLLAAVQFIGRHGSHLFKSAARGVSKSGSAGSESGHDLVTTGT
jgi:hypothetical protein